MVEWSIEHSYFEKLNISINPTAFWELGGGAVGRINVSFVSLESSILTASSLLLLFILFFTLRDVLLNRLMLSPSAKFQYVVDSELCAAVEY